MGSICQVDENYFNEIDSKDKAYWLGFLMADGCIHGNSIKIALSIKDLDQLERFKKSIKSTHKIGKYNVKLKGYDKTYKTCSISITRKKLAESLSKYGIVPRKSMIARFPNNIQEEYYLSFLLGVYDGDGNQADSYLSSGSYDFLQDIKDLFDIEYKIKPRKNKNGETYVYSLCLGFELRNKMLNDYEFSMPRKRKWGRKFLFEKGNSYAYGKRKLMDINIDIEWLKEEVYNRNLISIGKDFNVSEHTISRICHENNIKIPTPKDKAISKRKFEISKEELNKLINEDKIPLTKIGKMFGVSDNAIRKRAKMFKIMK